MLRLFATTCLSLLLATTVVHADRLDQLLAGAELGADEIYRKGTAESWGGWLARMMPISALTSTDRPFGRSYGLVIGVSDFGGSLDPLPATAENPLQMQQLLIDQNFDLVITLTNARATKERIEYLMVDVFPEIVTENDRFLFYFSGHGVVQASGEGFLPLTESQGAYFKMLPMRGVRTWDGSLRRVKQVLFLLDTCFSGLAGIEPQVDLRNLSVDQLAGYGHHLITAATEGEQTIASQTFSGSIFTSSLIEAAQGAADNPIRWDADDDGTKEEVKDGVISIYELLSHVRTEVAVRAENVGWGARITPQLYPLQSRREGEFFFVTQERVQEVSRTAHVAAVQSQAGTTGDPYGGRDVTVFEIIKDSTIHKDFEEFLGQFPDSTFAPYARNRLALSRQRETDTPPPTVTARLDPATEEAALNLRPEDRTVVQEALTALGFGPGRSDGVFGANTRRAIARWQRDRSEDSTSYLTATQYGRLLAEAEPKLAALATTRQKPEQASPMQPAGGVYKDQPGDEFRDCDDCPLMVILPPGNFTMGSPEAERRWAVEQGGRQESVEWDKLQHLVQIEQPFAVGKYEVTINQFRTFVQATNHDLSGGCWEWTSGGWKENASLNWHNPGFEQTDSNPVVCVNWDDAKSYIEWLSEKTGHRYDLLSEAEWEYAARAKTTTVRPWGDDPDNKAGCLYGNGADLTAKDKFSDWRTMDCRDGVVYTAPVGSYLGNNFMLHDMIGNVWEWVEDCWNDSYQGAPSDGSAWLSGDCSRRVRRGGSWDVEPGGLRAAYRGGNDPGFRGYVVGFRVARTLR